MIIPLVHSSACNKLPAVGKNIMSLLQVQDQIEKHHIFGFQVPFSQIWWIKMKSSAEYQNNSSLFWNITIFPIIFNFHLVRSVKKDCKGLISALLPRYTYILDVARIIIIEKVSCRKQYILENILFLWKMPSFKKYITVPLRFHYICKK